MIYEVPHGHDWPIEDVAMLAVQKKCDKFIHQGCIYKIDFSYRKIETTSMTDEEQARQFGEK